MKVAVVGAGNISGAHISVLKEMGEEIVAVCDIDIKKAEKAIKEFNLNAKAYLSYEELLTREKLEVVHICTPHYLHEKMITSALEKDINVLVEKPMCISKKEIKNILLAEEKSKAKLGVCQQNRYNQAVIFLKDFLKDKKVFCGAGKVFWKRDKQYYESALWRGNKKLEGGGVLINQALHALDLMQYFLGMPKSVVAKTENLTLGGFINVEDTAFISAKGEKPFTFFATNANSCDFPISLTFESELGVIGVCQNKVYLNGNIIYEEENERYHIKKIYGFGHKGLIFDFYNSIRENKPFKIDGKEGAKVVKLILSAYKSCGKEIKI